ncbi:IS200/IS605 family transposase [Paenibacillus sp. BAC0078]
MKLDSNNHSVFSLNYHLILCIKYRRKVLTDEISEYAKSVFERIGANYRITISEWNHDHDHIHVLFKAHPNTELSKFINAYKSASSRLIKKDFPVVKKKLWKEYFWSQSYCLITVGGAPLEVLKTYIENQGKEVKAE